MMRVLKASAEAINCSSYNLYNLPKNYSSLSHIFVIITSYFRHHYLIFSSLLPHICLLRIGTREIMKNLYCIPRPSYILLTSGTFTSMAIQLVVRRSGGDLDNCSVSKLAVQFINSSPLRQPCRSLNSKREIPSLQ